MIQIKAVLKNGTIYMGEIISHSGEGSFEDIVVKIRAFAPEGEPIAIEQVAYVTYVKIKDCKKIVLRNRGESHATTYEE
jgi:hypothetical protein